jgi:Divergent InlB B-repeat domain/Abnormal spindle-like microcephaly-assoc'd, ASPM-SPD-2-Hydin
MIRYFILALAVSPLAISPHCNPPKFAAVQFSPSSVTFAPQVVHPGGSSSAPQTVTLKNTGSAALEITTMASSGDFSQTSDCPVNPNTISPSATCTIQLTFAPNVIGNITGAITIVDNAIGGQQALPLSGTGLPPVGFTPASLDFGTIAVNSTSGTQAVTLTNNQNVALNIGAVVASGGYNVTAHTCSSPLAAGQSCTINVNFHPSVARAVPGALTVSTDASPGTQPVALTGSGSGPATANVNLSPANLAFGNHEAGTVSTGKSVTLTNTGSSSLSIQSIGTSGGYQSTNNCGTLISPGGTCTITVTFRPSADFANVDYPGAITIIDSDSSSPQIVGLSGTGTQPVTSSPRAIAFGTFDPNSAPTTQSLTLTNVHNAAEDISIASSGQFDLGTNNCPKTLASGGHCTANVGFPSASQPGPQIGALTITPSTTGFLSPTVVSLSACATQVAVSPRNFNFGAVAVNATSTAQTTIQNSGPDMNVSGIAITGTNSSDFTISNNTCGSTLVSTDACTLEITYSPQATGGRSAALSISDDGACSPQLENLSGGSAAGPFTLYLGMLPSGGSGNVTSSPTGINCGSLGSICSASFPAGTSVTLTAKADAGSYFSGWTQECSGSGTCALTMDSDQQVTSNFHAYPQLAVQFTGNGAGRVTSTPAGIDCPANQCSAGFAPGAAVTLTSTADSASKSTFTGWSGAGCSGTGKCTLTLNSDQTVMANYIAPDFSLTASSPTPSALSAGSGATSTVTLTSIDGFTSPVALTCSVDPSPALAPACSLNPSSATPTANGSVNSSLTISTSPPTVTTLAAPSGLFYALCLPLAGIAWFGADLSWRKRKMRLLEWACFSVLIAGTMLVASCGGGSVTNQPAQRIGGTPPGPYTITITGTSGASAQHSATVTLNVQ